MLLEWKDLCENFGYLEHYENSKPPANEDKRFPKLE
jgi:hypothetical protein